MRLTQFAVVALASLLPIAASAGVARLGAERHTPRSGVLMVKFFQTGGIAAGERRPLVCRNPVFPLICLASKPGSTGTLGMEVVGSNNPDVPLTGTWSWSTVIDKGTRLYDKLSGSFNPNPGNPTLETVSAPNGAREGMKYNQTITYCSSGYGCGTATAQIIVF